MSEPLLLLNYAHPLTAAQRAELAALCGGAALELREIPVQADRARPLGEVARELADAAGLDPAAWQSRALLVNPPGLAPLALALLAELHGRRGGFVTILNLRPAAGSTPTRYEVAELVNLQQLRDQARARR